MVLRVAMLELLLLLGRCCYDKDQDYEISGVVRYDCPFFDLSSRTLLSFCASVLD